MLRVLAVVVSGLCLLGCTNNAAKGDSKAAPKAAQKTELMTGASEVEPGDVDELPDLDNLDDIEPTGSSGQPELVDKSGNPPQDF